MDPPPDLSHLYSAVALVLQNVTGPGQHDDGLALHGDIHVAGVGDLQFPHDVAVEVHLVEAAVNGSEIDGAVGNCRRGDHAAAGGDFLEQAACRRIKNRHVAGRRSDEYAAVPNGRRTVVCHAAQVGDPQHLVLFSGGKTSEMPVGILKVDLSVDHGGRSVDRRGKANRQHLLKRQLECLAGRIASPCRIAFELRPVFSCECVWVFGESEIGGCLVRRLQRLGLACLSFRSF